MTENNKEPIDLRIARARANTINAIKGMDGWAVKIGKGQKMPDSKNHPRAHTQEKAAKILREIEFTDHNIGIHTHGKLVDVDIDIKDPEILKYAMPALDAYLPHSGHIWGTQKRPNTHRLYLLKETGDFDPRNYPILRSLQKIPEANIELRGGPSTSGLFSLLPPSLHPTDGYYYWRPNTDPTVSLSVTTASALVRAIRLAGATALLAPQWIEGQRQEMSVALAGFLHRIVTQSETFGGDELDMFSMSYDEALSFHDTLLEVIDDDPADRHMRKAGFERTWKKANTGAEVTGATRMQQLSGDDGLIKKLYALFTDNPELERYQEFEEQHAIWTGKGTVISMDALERKDVANCLMTKDQFVNSYMHKKVNLNGKMVPMSVLLYQSSTVSRLSGFTFDPSKNKRIIEEDDGSRFVNYWTGYEIEPNIEVEADEVKVFVDYVRHVLCKSDESHFTWVMSWLADMVQDPANKPGTVLVLVGEQGSGKSFLGERVMGPIIGKHHYVSPIQISRIGGQFNQMFGYKLLIQLDEAMNTNQRSRADFMKGLITGKTLEIEPKNHEVIILPACHRLLVTSNHVDNAVPLESGTRDRRYTILEVSNAKAQDVEYWEMMHEWFDKPENLALVHGYLANYQYDKKMIVQAQATEAKSKNAESSLDAFDRFILSIVERGHPLSPRTHNRWWQAPTGHPSERNEAAIIRDSWPEAISTETLASDYSLLQRDYPTNIREHVNVNKLVRKMAALGMLGEIKRIRYTELDDRTGSTTIARTRVRYLCSMKVMEDYLRLKHGELIIPEHTDVEYVPKEVKEDGETKIDF